MVIEELKYVRMHSTLGYEELKDQAIRILFLRVFFIIMKITMKRLSVQSGREGDSHWCPDSSCMRCILCIESGAVLPQGF